VKHGFRDPAATEDGRKFHIPDEYNADTDKRSWEETLAFLGRLMK